MRTLLLSTALVLTACGGAAAPADAPATAANVAPAASAAPDAVPAATAAPVATTEPAAPPPAAAVVAANVTATGVIEGKKFEPKLAQVSGPIGKDGRLLLTLSESADCTSSLSTQPGDAAITVIVPYKDGATVDLGTLKTPKAKPKTIADAIGEVSFSVKAAKGAPKLSTSFKPTGSIQIVSAPMEEKGMGKLKISLKSGGYAIDGEIPIKACYPPKGTAADQQH